MAKQRHDRVTGLLRQGDILLVPVDGLPTGAVSVARTGRLVLADGEATGHAHAVHERHAVCSRPGRGPLHRGVHAISSSTESRRRSSTKSTTRSGSRPAPIASCASASTNRGRGATGARWPTDGRGRAGDCLPLHGTVRGHRPREPAIDQDLAGERLVAYVRALGVETVPKVRWLPDLRALRQDRVARGGAAIGVPSRRGRDCSCGSRGSGCLSPRRG